MEHNFLLQIYHDGLLHVLENEIFYSCNMNKLKNTKDKKTIVLEFKKKNTSGIIFPKCHISLHVKKASRQLRLIKLQ